MEWIQKKVEDVKAYGIDHKKEIKDWVYLLFYCLILASLLLATAQTLKNKTNFYSENLTFRWENILSYDDIFYAREIYTTEENYAEEDLQERHVKHPFMSAIGHVVAQAEIILFSNLDETAHYYHIVLFQILVYLIGIVYLYKILRNLFHLENKWCFLLLTVYALSVVAFLGTVIIESFLLSATALIMSYYYLAKQKVLPSILLGILVTGITITNSIAFAIMAVCLLKKKRDILIVGAGCVLGLGLCIVALPYRDLFFANFSGKVNENLDKFVVKPEGKTALKMLFYYLLASPFFFIVPLYSKLYGLDRMTFELASGKTIFFITVALFIWMAVMVIRHWKDRRMLAALGVFACNMCIHAIVRFGLYEGTIYGLHFLFAEILMLAFTFTEKNKTMKWIGTVLILLALITQIRYNTKGILELLLRLQSWV